MKHAVQHAGIVEYLSGGRWRQTGGKGEGGGRREGAAHAPSQRAMSLQGQGSAAGGINRGSGSANTPCFTNERDTLSSDLKHTHTHREGERERLTGAVFPVPKVERWTSGTVRQVFNTDEIYKCF